MTFKHKNHISLEQGKRNLKKLNCCAAKYENYFLFIQVSGMETNYKIEDAKFSYQCDENELYSRIFSSISELISGKTLEEVSEMELGKKVVSLLQINQISFSPEKLVISAINPLKGKLGIKSF
jgi:hypothetical protein